MGAAVAMELALLMPENCNGLILINSLRHDGLKGKKVNSIDEIKEHYEYKVHLYNMITNVDTKMY